MNSMRCVCLKSVETMLSVNLARRLGLLRLLSLLCLLCLLGLLRFLGLLGCADVLAWFEE
jgi:hypothetical protein